MRTQAPTSPAAAPPAREAQPAPDVAVTTTQVSIAQPPPPSTAGELNALKARRTELSNQLQSATSRREQLARELRNPMVEGADRAGLEERLRLLDQRILRLETDIAISGQQLAAAPGRLVATAQVQQAFGGLPAEGVLALGALGTITVAAPLAIAAARLMWRRARITPPARQAVPSLENSPRLERLEQAVDAIAVELERVSEGQRFVTRLLAESHGAQDAAQALPAAASLGEGRRA
jgi:hypothetical protein